jgi:AcrR family transcriptional regulator
MVHVNIDTPMDIENPALTPPNRRRYGGILPEERQRQRRDKLIEGALEVFGTKGFHASTVREVCVAAHLTERYFYESFNSLPDLFVAVYSLLREQLMARTMSVLTSLQETTPLDMMAPALRVFLEFIQDDPRRGQIMLIDALGIDSHVARLSGETARDYSGLLKYHLTRLVPPEQLQSVNLDLLADGMIGMNVLLAARWMQDGFAVPIDEVVRTNMLPYEGFVALLDQRTGRSN